MSIKFDKKILLFLLVFYITNQLTIYLIFMTCIILHELFHLLAGLLLGAKPQTMEINQLGCSISFTYKINDYNKKILKGNIVELKKIFIYLAGPLFNLIVAIIALFLEIDSTIIYINIFIFFINLIGIYPLDGGRVIKSFIHIFMGEKRAYEVTLKTSNIFYIMLLVFTSVIILKFHNLGIIVGIIYITIIKIKNSKEINLKLRLINLIDNYKNEERPDA